MLKNRKEIEADILFLAKRFTPGGFGHQVYTNLFTAMSDDQFKQFWNAIVKSGFIPMFVDNYKRKEMISFELMGKLAKELDIPLEQQLIMVDPDSGLEYTTPQTALVGIVETRKQRQLQAKKFGASKHDHSIEDLTGQPTGDSRAGGISAPELNVLLGIGCPNVAKELADVRGGDVGAYRAFKNDILTTGRSTVEGSLAQGTGVKSLSTVYFLLRGELLDNNLRDSK